MQVCYFTHITLIKSIKVKKEKILDKLIDNALLGILPDFEF